MYVEIDVRSILLYVSELKQHGKKQTSETGNKWQTSVTKKKTTYDYRAKGFMHQRAPVKKL